MSDIRPLNTAVLSYGMSGEVFHCPLLDAHPGFDLTTVLERSKSRSSQRYPYVKLARSIDELLSMQEVELIVVNTPHETHFDLVSMVLEAGKHVVVEKPFTNTVEEGEKLISLAKEKGRMLSVFQNRRWDGDYLTVKQVIQQGMLGRVVELESHYDRYRPGIDLTTWKEKGGPGSGILYNLGSHMIDQALDLFGLPVSVSATVGIQRTNGLVDDFYDIRMEYANHRVILKSSYLVREPGPRYFIMGEQGTFIKHGIDPQEQALKDGLKPGTAGWGVEPVGEWGKINTTLGGLHVTGSVETIHGNYLGYYDSIYDHLRLGAPLVVEAEQSLNGIKLIEWAIASSRERRSIIL